MTNHDHFGPLCRSRLVGGLVVLLSLVVPALAQNPLTDGLVSRWTFDDSTYNDSVGENHGSAQGTGGSNLLSGNLTCGTASWANGTLNGTPTLANGGTFNANIVTAGGTATNIRLVITYTVPPS